MIRAVELARLSTNDLGICWKIFKRWDFMKEGKITINDLIGNVLGEERNMFTDSILELLVIKEEEKIDFGQFVLIIMTFALFETVEVLKFCFFIFDKDKNGFIHKDEFILFVEMIHSTGTGPVANIVNTVQQLDVDGDGKFTWNEFCALHKGFPQVLFPCFRLQIAMVRNVLGPEWWQHKKDFLLLEKIAEMEKNERMKRKQLAMLEKQRQAAIRRDMGFVDYYYKPMMRKFYDSKYPPTTADQLVQLDPTTIADKLARLSEGRGDDAFEAEEAKQEAAEAKEADEEKIVEAYQQIDKNMPEVGRAKKEGRRINYKQETRLIAVKKKKKADFKEKKYHAKIMDVAHGVVDPNGAITTT